MIELMETVLMLIADNFGNSLLIVTPKTSKLKILEFANSIDPNEVAHNEPPHLDLHCLHLHCLHCL